MIRGCARESIGSNKGLVTFEYYMGFRTSEIISYLAKYHSNTLENPYILLNEGINLSYILRTFKGLKKLSVGQLYGFKEFEWSENTLEELELYLREENDMSNTVNGIHQLKKLKVLGYSFRGINIPYIDFIEILQKLSSLSSLEMICL
jgi:hypothetical protein